MAQRSSRSNAEVGGSSPPRPLFKQPTHAALEPLPEETLAKDLGRDAFLTGQADFLAHLAGLEVLCLLPSVDWNHEVEY